MKKLVAAIFVLVLVFNWFGYRFVFDYLQQTASTTLESHLDRNLYDESQLIELKIPIHLPYQATWSTYERYDGEIEYKGSFYKYVKRKVANDTLYLKCINNPAKTKLELARNDVFKNNNDLANTNGKHQSKSNVTKNVLSEFEEFNSTINYKLPTGSIPVFYGKANTPFLPDPFSKTPSQPPEVAASALFI